MNTHRGDASAQTLAAAMSRRAALRTAGAGGLAGVLLGAGGRGTLAAASLATPGAAEATAKQLGTAVWITGEAVSWYLPDAKRTYRQLVLYRDSDVPYWLISGVWSPVDKPGPDLRAQFRETASSLSSSVQELKTLGYQATGVSPVAADPMPAYIADNAIVWTQFDAAHGAYLQLIGSFADGNLYVLGPNGLKPIDGQLRPQLQKTYATLASGADRLQALGQQVMQGT